MSRDSDTTNPHRTITKVEAEGITKNAPQYGACLVVIYGAEIGKRIALGAAPLIIGRSSRADLQIDEESISRQHARIENDSRGGYQVSDMGSTNGTYVNDVVIRRDPTTLRHGDQIQVGRSMLKFLAGGHIESAYHEEIYRLMTTDGLTQLLNRRAFEDALGRELARAVRHARPLSVCMFDVDKFKGINDSFGHLAGDAILRQIGSLLRANLRKNDIAGRLGGEEFGVIFPEVDSAGGAIATEKMRRLIEAHRFEFDNTQIPVTVSAGVAGRGPDDADAVDVIRKADELLYEAKHSGRNCVKVG